MKDINSLVTDIHGVLEGHGGWDAAVSAHFGGVMDNLMNVRLNPEGRSDKTLRMSNIGQPCGRKLWYHMNSGTGGTPLQPSTKLKFLYGDIIEEVLLSLAEASGHDVQGRQDRMELDGIVGHRDAVIDGMLVDVKSASTYGFKKFKEHGIRSDDPFGYLTQLASYLAASQSDPLVTEKNRAAFLAMDKQHGHICLDVYDLSREVANVQSLIEDRKAMVKAPTPPDRPYKDEPYQKSGNRAIPNVPCGYCDFKYTCWPGLRSFSGYKPVHLSKVVREPGVKEITP